MESPFFWKMYKDGSSHIMKPGWLYKNLKESDVLLKFKKAMLVALDKIERGEKCISLDFIKEIHKIIWSDAFNYSETRVKEAGSIRIKNVTCGGLNQDKSSLNYINQTSKMLTLLTKKLLNSFLEKLLPEKHFVSYRASKLEVTRLPHF